MIYICTTCGHTVRFRSDGRFCSWDCPHNAQPLRASLAHIEARIETGPPTATAGRAGGENAGCRSALPASATRRP